MATRMQQRRGTASQWTTANPVLNAGEFGWESDSNKFKIGDGTNHWNDLDYFADINSTINPSFGTNIVFEGATSDSYETTLQVTDPTADRTITLPNASGTVVLSDGSGNVTVSGNLNVQGTTTTVDSTTINVVNSFTFEGSTADSYETVLQVQDPTQDRTITLPDSTGTVILDASTQTLTNKTLALSANYVSGTVGEFNNAVTDGNFASLEGIETLTNKTLLAPSLENPSVFGLNITNDTIVFEGATPNAHETTLLVSDPTADRTITIPDVSGTVITTGNLSDINNLGTVSTIVFEGSTADEFEVTLAGGDPTADRAIALPDANGTLVTDTSTQTLTNKTLTSPAISGLSITDSSIVIEGSTADAFETTITVVDPTEDRTITIPNVTGTIITTGNLEDITSIGVVSSSVVFEGSTADAFELTLAAGDPTEDRTISFPDAGGVVVVDTATQTLTNKTLTSPEVSNLIITDGSIVLEGSSPDNFETTLTVTDPTADRIISFPDVTGTVVTSGDTGTVTSTMILDGTIVDGDINASAAIAWDKLSISSTVSSTEIGYVDGVTSAIQTQLNDKLESSTASTTYAPLASPTFTGTVSGVTATHVGLGNVDNTSDADKPVSTDTQTALDAKASLAGAVFTGNVEIDGSLVVDGDFTVNGTNFSASATSITIEDNLLQLAHQNAANTVDLGIVVGYNDGTAKHSGIVRDTSADKWKLFKGVTTEPATTVDFTQGSLDDLQVAGFEASSATIGDVSNTELQYLNGVTSAVQTQLDAKAPTANPTFTGTVTVAASGVAFTDGTQTKEGVPSRTPIVQKTDSYALSTLTHRDSLIEVSSTSGTTITIPEDSTVNYPIGTTIDILQTNTGQVTVAPVSGSVTVNATPGLKLRTRWSSATLMKRAANTWVVFGDLTA
jgi:hypothetical protein